MEVWVVCYVNQLTTASDSSFMWYVHVQCVFYSSCMACTFFSGTYIHMRVSTQCHIYTYMYMYILHILVSHVHTCVHQCLTHTYILVSHTHSTLEYLSTQYIAGMTIEVLRWLSISQV